MKSFAVIGLGRFGTHIATKLYERGCDVLAIDMFEQQVDGIADRVTSAVVADGKNRDVLQRIGIGECDCAVVAVASDLAASVLITMNLKILGVPKIICKAHDETHCDILKKLGADQVIIPEYIVADKLSRSLISPSLLEYIDLSDDYGIIERQTPTIWSGKTIRELNIRVKYGINIIAIRRGNDIKISPDAGEIIEENDVLILLGDNESFAALEKIKG